MSRWWLLRLRWHLRVASYHEGRIQKHQNRFDRATARVDNLF